jgi:DNA-3-methyladenine glycosylase II
LAERFEELGAEHIARRDPAMRAVIRAVGEIELPRRRRRFESLVRAIIAQQLSTAAARTIYDRVRQLCGGALVVERLDRLPDAELRAAGLSAAKLRSVRDLSEHCASGQVRLGRMHRLGDEAVVGELTQVFGIGRWSAEMFLIFVLTRPDVFPAGDLGIQKGFQKAYELRSLPTVERMLAVTEAWRPYRTVGAWYLWRLLDLRD